MLLAGLVGLVLELVGPVAEIVRRLRKILRPQIGFPERIARRRFQVPESQVDFRLIAEPPFPLPQGLLRVLSLLVLHCRLPGLLTLGDVLAFLGQFVELLGELLVL